MSDLIRKIVEQAKSDEDDRNRARWPGWDAGSTLGDWLPSGESLIAILSEIAAPQEFAESVRQVSCPALDAAPVSVSVASKPMLTEWRDGFQGIASRYAPAAPGASSCINVASAAPDGRWCVVEADSRKELAAGTAPALQAAQDAADAWIRANPDKAPGTLPDAFPRAPVDDAEREACALNAGQRPLSPHCAVEDPMAGFCWRAPGHGGDHVATRPSGAPHHVLARWPSTTPAPGVIGEATTARHPMQPVIIAKDGVHRYKANAIVRHLLNDGPFNMNTIALRDFSDEDREQFAQLIGYSVSGACDLDYMSDEVCSAALEASKALLASVPPPEAPAKSCEGCGCVPCAGNGGECPGRMRKAGVIGEARALPEGAEWGNDDCLTVPSCSVHSANGREIIGEADRDGDWWAHGLGEATIIASGTATPPTLTAARAACEAALWWAGVFGEDKPPADERCSCGHWSTQHCDSDEWRRCDSVGCRCDNFEPAEAGESTTSDARDGTECADCDCDHAPDGDCHCGHRQNHPWAATTTAHVKARAAALRWCAGVARTQPFAPDTKNGHRQAWVRENIARRIEGKEPQAYEARAGGAGDSIRHDDECAVTLGYAEPCNCGGSSAATKAADGGAGWRKQQPTPDEVARHRWWWLRECDGADEWPLHMTVKDGIAYAGEAQMAIPVDRIIGGEWAPCVPPSDSDAVIDARLRAAGVDPERELRRAMATVDAAEQRASGAPANPPRPLDADHCECPDGFKECNRPAENCEGGCHRCGKERPLDAGVTGGALDPATLIESIDVALRAIDEGDDGRTCVIPLINARATVERLARDLDERKREIASLKIAHSDSVAAVQQERDRWQERAGLAESEIADMVREMDRYFAANYCGCSADFGKPLKAVLAIIARCDVLDDALVKAALDDAPVPHSDRCSLALASTGIRLCDADGDDGGCVALDEKDAQSWQAKYEREKQRRDTERSIGYQTTADFRVRAEKAEADRSRLALANADMERRLGEVTAEHASRVDQLHGSHREYVERIMAGVHAGAAVFGIRAEAVGFANLAEKLHKALTAAVEKARADGVEEALLGVHALRASCVGGWYDALNAAESTLRALLPPPVGQGSMNKDGAK